VAADFVHLTDCLPGHEGVAAVVGFAEAFAPRGATLPPRGSGAPESQPPAAVDLQESS